MSKGNEQLMKLISRVLSVPIDILNDNTKPDEIESWDSVNGLMMVSELES